MEYDDDQNSKLFKVIIAVLCIGMIIAGAAAYYFYDQNKRTIAKTQDSANKEAEYIDHVSTLVVVPSGEEAVVARVDDASKFDNQQFFSNAQNGDVFVIYPKAKRAYLYRPSVNKIVDVGPVGSKSTTNQSTPTATPK